MNEKELIRKIQGLREIKPRKDWVVLTKQRILEPTFAEATAGKREQISRGRVSSILEILPNLIFQRKFAYAIITVLMIFVGVFGFAQYTVPGDLLFPIKKITEQSQTAFTPQGQQIKHDLEIANRRFQELLTQVVRENRVKNIAPALKEAERSISQAAKSLTANETIQKNTEAIKDIAIQVKKLEDNKKQLESFGVVVGEDDGLQELNNVLASLIQAEIENLEKSSLTENQQKSLIEIKGAYDNGNYSEALEKILMITQ